MPLCHFVSCNLPAKSPQWSLSNHHRVTACASHIRCQDGPQMRAPRTEFAETSKPWSPCRTIFLSMLCPISNFIWESAMTKKPGSFIWRLLGVKLGVARARWKVTLRLAHAAACRFAEL